MFMFIILLFLVFSAVEGILILIFLLMFGSFAVVALVVWSYLLCMYVQLYANEVVTFFSFFFSMDTESAIYCALYKLIVMWLIFIEFSIEIRISSVCVIDRSMRFNLLCL